MSAPDHDSDDRPDLGAPPCPVCACPTTAWVLTPVARGRQVDLCRSCHGTAQVGGVEALEFTRRVNGGRGW